MEKSDILKTKEAAAYLRFTTRTLYRMAHAGIIPASRVGISWRFSRAVLEQYVRAQIDKEKDS